MRIGSAAIAAPVDAAIGTGVACRGGVDVHIVFTDHARWNLTRMYKKSLLLATSITADPDALTELEQAAPLRQTDVYASLERESKRDSPQMIIR